MTAIAFKPPVLEKIVHTQDVKALSVRLQRKKKKKPIIHHDYINHPTYLASGSVQKTPYRLSEILTFA